MEDEDDVIEHTPVSVSDVGWDKLVVFTIGKDRHLVRDVEEAYRILSGDWQNKQGPSYRRAVDTCEAALVGERPESAARITFTVALMEAGLSFQLYRDEVDMLEDEVAKVISRDMASMQMEDMIGRR